jgi:uncharacterized membrane protein
MSSLYGWIKLLHVLSAAVLFGTGLGTAFHMWLAHRSGDVRAIAAAARSTVLADWLFTTPAILLQPATGLLLANLAGIDLGEPWLRLVYALYALAGACWLPVVWLQLRVRTMAGAALAGNTQLPAAYQACMRAWFWLGWPAFAAVLAIYALMVTRPDL